MLRLGLGLGLSESSGTTAAAESFDWLNYDGQSNASVQQLFTGGGIRGQDIAAVDDDEAVLYYNDDITEQYCVVLDNDGTVNTPVEFSVPPAIAGLVGIVKLTDTRFIAISITGSFYYRAFLIGKSGKVLSELDESGEIAAYTAAGWTLARLNDTQAVFTYSTNAIREANSLIIDITSDTISLGAVETTATLASAGSYMGVDRLTDTRFAMAFGNQVFEYSVSGTDITEETTQFIDASETIHSEMELVALSENEWLVVYELQSSAGMIATYFSTNGSTITRGDSKKFSDAGSFQAWGAVTSLGNRQVAYVHEHSGSYSTDGAHITTFGVTNSGEIILGATTRITNDVDSDHATISASDGYIWTVYQDETTTPVQQVGFVLGVKPTVPYVHTLPETNIQSAWPDALAEFDVLNDYSYNSSYGILRSRIDTQDGLLLGNRDFSEVVGVSGGGMQLTGTEYFVHKNYAQSQFLNRLQDANNTFSLYLLLDVPASIGSTEYVFNVGNSGSTSDYGFVLNFRSNGNIDVQLRGGGGGEFCVAANPAGLNLGATNLVCISVDTQAPPTGGTTIFINSEDSTFDDWSQTRTVTGDASRPLKIGARYADGTSPLPNGFTFYDIGWGEGEIDSSLRDDIKAYLNTKHGLSL